MRIEIIQQKVSVMKTTTKEIRELSTNRTIFIETLSYQFLAATGCGVYVYLTPVDVNGLFNQFSSGNLPIKIFVRQCVKSIVGS